MIRLRDILYEHSLDNTVATFERTLLSLFPEIENIGFYIDPDNNSLFLSDFYIKPEFRGMGVGSKIMTQVVAFADKHGLTMVLIPEPEDDDMTPEQLVSFYKKFGFVVNAGKNLLSIPGATSMYRAPKKV